MAFKFTFDQEITMQRFFQLRIVWITGLLLASLMSACQPIQPPLAPTNDHAATTTVTEKVTRTAGTTVVTVPEVVFVGKEYSFDGPESIPSGWTQLTLHNQGELSHDLILFKLAEGKTMDGVMAALESEGPPEWITLYGQITAEPGTHNMFMTNLAPGSYGMISFGENAGGPPDAAQGMVAALTVTEETNGATEAALPQTEASIELVDFSFVVNGLQSGEQLVRLQNTGNQAHEAVIFRLKAGALLADVQALLDAEMKGEEVSDDMVDAIVEQKGSMMLESGLVSYIKLTLEPGTYVLLCFLPSQEHDGKPHHALGMVQQVTIK
jgi:hypothetical protein